MYIGYSNLEKLGGLAPHPLVEECFAALDVVVKVSSKLVDEIDGVVSVRSTGVPVV